MGLIPENWRRAISFEDAQDALKTLNRGKSKAEQEQEEMAKLKAEKEKVELQAEIRKAKREVYMAEKDETIEELAQQFEEQGKSPQMAKRLARMAVGEGSSSGGGEGFDGLIKYLMIERMMGSGSKPSPWGEAGAAFLKGMASKAGQVMGDVIETAKDRLILPPSPGTGISLDDVKSAPENRRIRWRKEQDGYVLENLPAGAPSGDSGPPLSPAEIITRAMDNYKAIANGVAEVAEKLGYTRELPKENNVKTYNIDFSSNGKTISIPFPMSSDGAGKIIDYLVRSEELTQKTRAEDERMAGLHGLVAWLAGIGTPQDVYAQARQRAEALTARYRKREEEPGSPEAQAPGVNPTPFEGEENRDAPPYPPPFEGEVVPESEVAFEPASDEMY